MALVIAVFALSVAGTRTGPPPSAGDPLASVLDTVGHLSTALVNGEDTQRLREHLDEAAAGRTARFLVFRAAQSERSVAAIPTELRELVMAAQADDQLHFCHTSTFSAFGKRVGTAQGALVLVFTGPPMPSLWQHALDPRLLVPRIAAVLLVGGLVCYGLARSLTAPLRRLSTAAGQLATGNLSYRVGLQLIKRKDEIAQLGRNFDRMADRIETLVTSQRRLLQDVSHELRSPLARLNVALALLRQKTTAEATEHLDRMEREADRLNNLIGELLTLTSLESQADEPWEQIDVPALVETLVEDAQFEASSRRVSVRLVETQPVRVLGHLNLLCRAVENILRNAVQHTAEGTLVEVWVAQEPAGQDSEAVIRIRDHGPGVPERELDSIVQPFYTIRNNRSVHCEGHGLGLTIAHRIVHQLRGRITLRNTAQGGLTVEIRLPSSPRSR